MRRGSARKRIVLPVLAVLTAVLVLFTAGCAGRRGEKGSVVTGPSVVTHDGSTFVIKNDNSLWAWGANASGQLGDGTTNDRGTPAHILDSVASVICCGDHTYAIKTDGALYGWGANDGKFVFLGDGTSEQRLSPVRIMENVIEVIPRGGVTYAITADHELYSWGENSGGLLGDGTLVARLTPVRVMNGVAAVDSGRLITTDGDLYHFGGQDLSGTGRKNRSVKPYKVLESVSELIGEDMALTKDGKLMTYVPAGLTGTGSEGHVTVAEDVICALPLWNDNYWDCFFITKDNALWAYGDNYNGILGDGTTDERLEPVKLMDGVAKIYADSWHDEDYGYQYGFIVRTNGELWSWGEDFCGSLGRVTYDWPELTPQLAAESVRDVVTDGWSTFIIKKDGSLWACGYNGDGLLIGHPGDRARLGDGSTENRHDFVKIMNNTALFVHDLSISYSEDGSGDYFTDYSRSYAVSPTGTLYGWGYNADGLLGTGETGTVLEPTLIMEGIRIAS